VATRSIIEAFDVGEEIAPGVLPCCIMPVMDKLGLERVEEALHRGVVVAVGPAAASTSVTFTRRDAKALC
jgi:hypothetical protein